jgi:hypothetical protein
MATDAVTDRADALAIKTKATADALAEETKVAAHDLAEATAHRAQVNDLSTALILSRFDVQDKRFDTQDKVLDGILREARRTNGRVAALEAANTADTVRAEVIDEGVIKQHEALAARRDRLRFYMTCATVLLSPQKGGNLYG